MENIIKITDTLTLSKRNHSEIIFWQIVKENLEKYKQEKDEKYQYITVIFAYITLESLLNNLCEFYFQIASKNYALSVQDFSF